MAFRLARLQRNIPIVGADGKPTIVFQRWWDSFVNAIETQEALQDDLIAQVQANQLDIIAAQDDLAAQLALITTAQNTADAVTTSNAISASFIGPSAPLTASDAGTDATITVTNFTRYYDDGVSPVSITSAPLTGLAYSTTYYVYYDDATRANTTPTLVAVTNGITSRHNYVAGRHFVGEVITPASGGADITGGSFPPGGGTVDTEFP